MPRGDSRERRQRRAARILARGGRANEAADSAGVSSQTISRWKRDPDFVAMISEESASGEVVVNLAPPTGSVEALPSNWRQLASLQLASAVSPAIRIMTDALQGADVSKAQLDTARWVVERMAIEAPAEQEAEEISSSEELIEALASELSERMIRAVLERKVAG